MTDCSLTLAALRALSEMRAHHVFEDDPAFLDDVLDALRQLADLTHEERQLRAELEGMPPLARASLSRAIRAAWGESARH